MNCNGQIIILWDKGGNDGVCKWPFPGRHSQNETKLGKWFALTSGKSWSPGHPWKALTYEWEENSLQCMLMAWAWTEGSFECYQHYADRKLYIALLKEKEKKNQNETVASKSMEEGGNLAREPCVCWAALGKALSCLTNDGTCKDGHVSKNWASTFKLCVCICAPAQGQSLVQHCLGRRALSCWRPLVVAEEMQLFKVQLFKVQPLLGSLSVYFVIQYLAVKEFQGMLLSCYIELKWKCSLF